MALYSFCARVACFCVDMVVNIWLDSVDMTIGIYATAGGVRSLQIRLFVTRCVVALSVAPSRAFAL